MAAEDQPAPYVAPVKKPQHGELAAEEEYEEEEEDEEDEEAQDSQANEEEDY